MELLLHASVGLSGVAAPGDSLPLKDSLATRVHGSDLVLPLDDLNAAPFDRSVEFLHFGAQAYIGAPVRDPANATIGVLAALQGTPRGWRLEDAKLLDDTAYLASQQIMLKASFETLKILSRDRRARAN